MASQKPVIWYQGQELNTPENLSFYFKNSPYG